MLNLLFPVLALLRLANAYQCKDFFIPITSVAPSYELGFPPLADQLQAVAFLLEITNRDAASAPSPFTGVQNVTLDLEISVRFCEPDPGCEKFDIVQVLTHGLGFDKTYWDFGGTNSSYDYILAATNAGYSTLSYDRIGTGLSSVPDPYTIGQAPIELAVLTTLTEKLRSRSLGHAVPKPSKVIHVGHSFGSILTNALVATTPSLSDGIVLTARFGNRSTGYVTWGDEYANQYGFLHYPNFDPTVLAAAEAGKYPFTIGEVLTGPPVVPVDAPDFKGPVLMISGVYDLILCGADCNDVVPGPLSPLLFPNASTFEGYLQPDTGHGMNLHYNATGTYGVIMDFLERTVA